MESMKHSSVKSVIFRPWECHRKRLIEPETSCPVKNGEFSFSSNFSEANFLQSNRTILPTEKIHKDDGSTFLFGLTHYKAEEFYNFPWTEWKPLQSETNFQVLSKWARVPPTFHQGTAMERENFEQQRSFTFSTLFGDNQTKHQKTRRRTRDEKKRFRCHVCHSTFNNKGQLKGHLRIHTGERPFVCPQCLKTFTRNEELTRHKRIHSGIRPFACDKCGKSFGRKDHLKKHTRIHNRIQAVFNETNPNSTTVYLHRPKSSYLFSTVMS